MKNKYRILKIAVTLIILGYLMSFSLSRFSNIKIAENTISVQLNSENGVYFIDEKAVKDFVLSKNPSKKVGDLDVPLLEKEINHFPSVDAANVYVNLDGKLHIDISQKVPAFRLHTSKEQFYVDKNGVAFPISKKYAHPSMLVNGEVKKSEYKDLVRLVEKIEQDPFCKKYFIGISKKQKDYYLITSEGNYNIVLGDLEDIDFKIKGFKVFVEKYLVYQNPEKYSQISLKYKNQIVTTFNKNTNELSPISQTNKTEKDE